MSQNTSFESVAALFAGTLRQHFPARLEGEKTNLDLSTMNRLWQMTIVPFGLATSLAQWQYSAEVSWAWSALDTARHYTTEEDLVCELTGDWQGADTIAIELYVHVEYKLHPPKDLPYPSMASIKQWWQKGLRAFYRQNPAIKELPDDPMHIGYLTYNFEPTLMTTLEDGKPRLERIQLRTRRTLYVPRSFDDPDKLAEEEPLEEQVQSLALIIKDSCVSLRESIAYLVPPNHG